MTNCCTCGKPVHDAYVVPDPLDGSPSCLVCAVDLDIKIAKATGTLDAYLAADDALVAA